MILNYSNTTIKIGSITKYLILAFIFLYIYTPLVLLPFNVTHLLTLIALTFLFIKFRKDFLNLLNSPELVPFIVLHIFIIICTLVLNSLCSGDFSTTYFAASTLVEVLPCAIFISIVLLGLKIDLMRFYDVILGIGLFQVVWVILSLIFPGLREWILSSPGNQALLDAEGVLNKFRMFGLARGYTFTMPLFQGVCIIIAFVLGAYKSTRYYLLIPLYLFSIVLNARIALVSLPIVLFVIFCFEFKKHFIKQIIYILLFLLTLFCAAQFIEYKAENSSSFDIWTWMYSAIDEVLSFIEGNPKEGLTYLTDIMWFRPEGIGLLFGTGENVFGRSNQSSDIGYVINLYYGGAVFSIMLYLSYLILLLKNCSSLLCEKIINISVCVYLFVANLKGNVFMPNEVINGAILMIVFSIAARKFHESNSEVSFHSVKTGNFLAAISDEQ
jgi:hypothetical protein